MNRFLGIDIGAETLKVVELVRDGARLRWTRRILVEHAKAPTAKLLSTLEDLGWSTVRGAATSGRLSRALDLTRVPTKQTLTEAHRFLVGRGDATIVSVGSHGFSVLELREHGADVFRENGRCSQGTGNFLRQLVERFGLAIGEASELCAGVTEPAPLSGRCPVILKTDMTHLANKGVSRERILAGLYDAVCENVQVQIKPRISPPNVSLIGGVARSVRIRENFRRFLARHEMKLVEVDENDAPFYEALGCALVAAREVAGVPALDALVRPRREANLDRVPPLRDSLRHVKRMPPPAAPRPEAREVILGFDIGSTGSKVVAMAATRAPGDSPTESPVFEAYVRTAGDPVGASQDLMRRFASEAGDRLKPVALGVTGSGREIAGSLMTICYGAERVFVMNEIAAHAEGALNYDRRVDTIFEIGGQDAKYVRLEGGRVVDAAMNEACSAGTGSFIEEQGGKLSGFAGVAELSRTALSAHSGVSLGQHCSVFMAEIIDEAVAAGVPQNSIVAGVYDSVVQNYLNRVKGSRSIGQVVFCQGMPFSSDALAASVARQTGCEVVVPPSPGTVGALGIALLARRLLAIDRDAAIEPSRFLEARVEKRDSFVCNATSGCGGSGNKCRIDRIDTRVSGEARRFVWGGACSLYDKGTRKKKLPDRAPDPFRERQELVEAVIADPPGGPAGPVVGMVDAFQLKGLIPFFATFVRSLGLSAKVIAGADLEDLKHGIEEAHVPFCAPMQQYHGQVSRLARLEPDYILCPMIRSLPRIQDENTASVCPIVQATPDLIGLDLGPAGAKVVSPIIDLETGGYESAPFKAGCRDLARKLGVKDDRWIEAHRRAVTAQLAFESGLGEIGRRALSFCREHQVTPVVVLGRPYTIHNTILNSNVPALLREQGVLPVPIDCYPVDDTEPLIASMYWSHGQRILRAAAQIRQTQDMFGVYCSNYSCGPDSFNLHFFAQIMEGKPFAVIETDGHSGDAGTKTRIEAFLHCVREHLAAGPAAAGTASRRRSLREIDTDVRTIPLMRANGDRLLLPWMGRGTRMLAAVMRGLGIPTECLPVPRRETLQLGRRHTSGKECLPMCVTLGSLLERVERQQDRREHLTLFMPTANGPCRFGVYNLLHKVVLDRLGLGDRVHVFTPHTDDYFEGVAQGVAVQVVTGFAAGDLLAHCYHHARAAESRPGAAAELYDRYEERIADLLENQTRRDTSLMGTLLEVASGRLFGVTKMLRRAAEEFAAITLLEERPTVLVTGEIYVRCEPFSNDHIVEKLLSRGIRVRLTPFSEWIEYVDSWNITEGRKSGFGAQVSSMMLRRIQRLLYKAIQKPLGLPPRTSVPEALAAAAPYVRRALGGESVLTIGGAVHDWREGHIDGVVSVGPLECMPNKISESQFFHVAQREGLLSITLPLNGDPIDPEVLDTFTYEIEAQFKARQASVQAQHSRRRS